jgi:hypothetical protein
LEFTDFVEVNGHDDLDKYFDDPDWIDVGFAVLEHPTS